MKKELFVPRELVETLLRKGFKSSNVFYYVQISYPLDEAIEKTGTSWGIAVDSTNTYSEIRFIYIDNEDAEFHWNEGTYDRGEHSRCDLLDSIPAPLYVEVSEWLRVKQGLHLVTVPNELQPGKWHYHRFDLRGENRESEPELVHKFDTEEEALIEGINQCLKLI